MTTEQTAITQAIVQTAVKAMKVQPQINVTMGLEASQQEWDPNYVNPH